MDNPASKLFVFPLIAWSKAVPPGNGDARLTCIACHNPHQPSVRDISAYDQKCLSCHVKSASVKRSADHPGAACPVKSSNRRKLSYAEDQVPQTHSRFTDHRIRVVRHPGEIPTRWDDTNPRESKT